ncbi:hypothetical protein [Candidatus Odyssella acanthamoebae]|uniref:Uncharacterized protein n=1 Tax=Candidatus Odyssella acanthamoebae TaxID=91604 RepID=A0A077AR19_9PROT|nr:hypothetical protein [Candidatus Paracaedibacter acanthamoebae]AIK95632.1 hypothetical protein ID47_01015 [Candidatus Paracaedibacter acanthamoebae]
MVKSNYIFYKKLINIINNIYSALAIRDFGKRLDNSMVGFQSFTYKTANRSLKGIEAMARMVEEQTIYLTESFKIRFNFSTVFSKVMPKLRPRYFPLQQP